MIFLARRWNEHTAAWWNCSAGDKDAPAIVRELLRGEQVVCDRAEAEEAIAWARGRDGWNDDAAPLYVRET